jgi:LEA14-like dessication related protein
MILQINSRTNLRYFRLNNTALSFLILIAVTICGCATLQNLVQKPQISFKGMHVNNMSLFEGDLVFKFEVTNPNPVGATLTNVAYNLKLNDEDFIKGNLNKGLSLKAGGSSIVELPVTINYFDLFETVAEVIETGEVAYNLAGSMGVGPFNIPYQTKGSFPIPKLPKVSLKDVRISDIALTGATMKLVLDMKNDNPFTVALSGLKYGLKLGGKEVANGVVKEIPPIGEKTSSVLEIPLKLSFFKLGRSVYNLLTESSSDYELTGEMKVAVPEKGEKSFTFQKAGKVPFRKE